MVQMLLGGSFQPSGLDVTQDMLDVATRRFRETKTGLPELAKNSWDKYVSVDATESEKVIVILMRGGRGRGQPPMIGCLDFGGMTPEDFEDFKTWGTADPSHHGNGGKAYLCQGFEGGSRIVSVSDSKLNVFGFEPGNFEPGHFGHRNRRIGDVTCPL